MVFPILSHRVAKSKTLRRLRKSLNFTTPIYTFGFGYSLERGLLYDLAKHGNGSNGHIPDGGMIATVFCHSIATVLSTVVVNLQLHIIYNEDLNFADINPIMGDYVHNVDDDNSRSVVIDLGTVQLGQMRNIIMNTDYVKSDFSYYYTYKIGGKSYTSDAIIVNTSSIPVDEKNVNIHVTRCTTIELIRKIINYKTVNNTDAAISLYHKLEEHFTSDAQNMTDKLTLGIKKNINGSGTGEGQIKLAITDNAFYTRWGEYYLDQFTRSLNQQTKPNFRDPGCPFGGELFEKLVDKASDVFDVLPPPEPSLIIQKPPQNNPIYRGMSMGSSPQPVPLPHRASTLVAYNSQATDTPCFDSNCNIRMADGSNKQLKNLKKRGRD